MPTVLIVDDDPHIRSGMTTLVRFCGHAAEAVGTVREGLERLAAGPTHLLLDLNLPDGLGTTILRRVRDARLPVRVAVLSGTADAALLAEVAALAPDAMFQKPPDWDAVTDWIAGTPADR